MPFAAQWFVFRQSGDWRSREGAASGAKPGLKRTERSRHAGGPRRSPLDPFARGGHRLPHWRYFHQNGLPLDGTPSHPGGNEKRDLLLAQRGDRDAFGRIVTAYRERVYWAALALLRNEEDALDVSQDAFVKAYRALGRFDINRPFFPWIYRILRNTCMSHLARHRPGRTVSLDQIVEEVGDRFPASGENPRQSARRHERKEHLLAAIERLKPAHREILALKHFEEMSYAEISEALGIPMGTVMSRLHHARRALAREIEGEDLR